MANLPQIPGARKKGVILLSSEEDFKKLDEYHINDTVCIDGPFRLAFSLAESIHEKYKVGVKVVSSNKPQNGLAADIEVIDSQIQEIVGEGRAEAVKFKDGKAVGVCLVLFLDKAMADKAEDKPDLLVQLGTKGAEAVLSLCRQSLDKTIAQKGQSEKIEFPETNYYLPLINALLNIEVKTLADCQLAFSQAENIAKGQAASSGLIINSL
ncbi:MAG: hypothetical protein WC357_02670, partial [Candidatus Omnitrophota bacterium]